MSKKVLKWGQTIKCRRCRKKFKTYGYRACDPCRQVEYERRPEKERRYKEGGKRKACNARNNPKHNFRRNWLNARGVPPFARRRWIRTHPGEISGLDAMAHLVQKRRAQTQAPPTRQKPAALSMFEQVTGLRL